MLLGTVVRMSLPASRVLKPPKSDTLLSPDWGYVETQDKGAILRGEFDLSDHLMATVFNEAGDFRASISQLKHDLEKTSGELGLIRCF